MPLDDEDLAEAEAAFQRWSEHNPHWTDPKTAFLAGFQLGREPVSYPGIDREPQERLARLCAVAAKAIRDDPEGGQGPNLIIMVDDDGKGGIEMSGWRDTVEGVAALMRHLRQLMKAHDISFVEYLMMMEKMPGERVVLMPASEVPEGLRKDKRD